MVFLYIGNPGEPWNQIINLDQMAYCEECGDTDGQGKYIKVHFSDKCYSIMYDTTMAQFHQMIKRATDLEEATAQELEERGL